MPISYMAKMGKNELVSMEVLICISRNIRYSASKAIKAEI